MNDLIATEEKDLSIARLPKEILAEAQTAAKALQDVISKKAKPVKFNGEQYLEFEDWQTIGKFYGLAVSTRSPKIVIIEGIVGAEAEAEVVDVRTGRVIGRASAWCLRDEPNWRTKPFHQLASMAQTRAGAKALRNLLSWVVVLAGYRSTPAEEMEAHHAEVVTTSAPVKSADNRVEEILNKLVEMHEGDQDEVEKHLKFITKYNAKTGEEKWLKISDLEAVATRKPEWIDRIHAKVCSAYDLYKGK